MRKTKIRSLAHFQERFFRVPNYRCCCCYPRLTVKKIKFCDEEDVGGVACDPEQFISTNLIACSGGYMGGGIPGVNGSLKIAECDEILRIYIYIYMVYM